MNPEMNLQIPALIGTPKSDGLLQFSPISINPDYCEKWNIYLNDFVCLTRNGQLLRDTLYRIGGLNYPKLNEDRYFMLLKHTEAYYSAEIMKMSTSKNKDKAVRHLESQWCILDKAGNEKVVMEPYKYCHLVKDSCIYSTDNKYYNIDTGLFYGEANRVIQSDKYLFFEKKYGEDPEKRGVIQIQKDDGSWLMLK